MEIVYSAHAEMNLNEIFDYGVVNWGVDRAISFVTFLQDEIDILTDFPELGKRYENDNLMLLEGLRALDIDNYKTLYRLGKNDIEIVSILPKGRPHLSSSKPPLQPL
ncbi:type II toxin-antitoxin system RelE/ParE family toxin [Hellea balneolensis]|uniref:type II toxin-antitoxin system RelE/ParE family toxin n=1 Tax=Hellea balneolensis TaxID=287478 RepID=UPI00041ACFF8|nr:type II toxin-antitoxin system RelE/ParE family toxin [Hellea balneolensis]